MLGLGCMAEICEVAWIQGEDLYSALDNRLLTCYEYLAKYNLGSDDVPFFTWTDKTGKYCNWVTISTQARGQFRSVFEIAYAHYAGRKHLEMPYTAQVLARIRPEGKGWTCDHPGFGSLLFWQGHPDIYHDGWTDFNKNGVKDVYEDPSAPLDDRIHDLLSQMTLEEKTCQMVTLYGSGRVLKDDLPTPAWKEAVWKDGVGNIDEEHNGYPKYNSPYAADFRQHVDALHTIQRWFVEQTRLGIPVDFTNEGIRGLCSVGATYFPAQCGQGATWDKDLIAKIGENMSVRRIDKASGQVLASYIHGGGNIGVIVAADGADNDANKEALKNIAMQVAAMNPQYVSRDEISEDELAGIKNITLESALNDPFTLPKPILNELLDKAVFAARRLFVFEEGEDEEDIDLKAVYRLRPEFLEVFEAFLKKNHFTDFILLDEEDDPQVWAAMAEYRFYKTGSEQEGSESIEE